LATRAAITASSSCAATISDSEGGGSGAAMAGIRPNTRASTASVAA
jgi:hypothetical protein